MASVWTSFDELQTRPELLQARFQVADLLVYDFRLTLVVTHRPHEFLVLDADFLHEPLLFGLEGGAVVLHRVEERLELSEPGLDRIGELADGGVDLLTLGIGFGELVVAPAFDFLLPIFGLLLLGIGIVQGLRLLPERRFACLLLFGQVVPLCPERVYDLLSLVDHDIRDEQEAARARGEHRRDHKPCDQAG
ncbi:MAG: hypothetical protein ACYTFI_28950 [Planctomycetota bacterium]|jgi:hypothetical protein